MPKSPESRCWFCWVRGLLSRITDRAGVPPKNPASAPLEIRTDQSQPVTETVDLSNGNLHVEIPIRATRHKKAAPRSGH